MDILAARSARRIAVATTATLGLVLLGAGPAGAHVEARAEGAQAGTGPVTVNFLAEAESTTAGIVGVKTQLPAGVAPDQVSLVTGPSGWTLAPTADGYEIGGPDIGPGVDLEYGISIAQLPSDATTLPFKLLLRYSDGREDPWIELPTESNPEPENPAPTITVAPAPPSATTAPSTTGAAPTTAADSSAPAAEDVAQSDEDSGSNVGVLVAVAVVVLAALAGGLWFWRSRASRGA